MFDFYTSETNQCNFDFYPVDTNQCNADLCPAETNQDCVDFDTAKINQFCNVDLYTSETTPYLGEHCCEPFLSFNNNELFHATMVALETGNLSQLAKEELKYTILSRRLATGQGELKIDFPEPVQYKLTEEEQTKIIKRREQNRLAAQRFRKKRREKMKTLSRIKELEVDLSTKMAEIEKLRQEKSELQKTLHYHLSTCHSV